MAEAVVNFRQTGKKILCVGRNYKALAKEQGRPIPKKPIVFMKPTTAYITDGEVIKIPDGCQNFYHEVELGVVIGKTMKGIPESDVMSHVAGYALCLDMTAQDMQLNAKSKGQPWCLSKGFDTACPVSDFIPKTEVVDTAQLRLWLKIDGDMRQDSSTDDMIFPVPHVLSYLSRYFTLEPGDLVLTGSPAGAGPVTRGQRIDAGLETATKQLKTIAFMVE